MSNLLQDNFPELEKYWLKDNEILFSQATIGSNKKVKWICKKGHIDISSIKVMVNKIKKNKGDVLCGYCNNRKILRGFNDMWTTNPELATLLKEQELGYELFQFGSQRVDWQCPDCHSIIKNKRVRDVSIDGLSCPNCSPSISYGERYVRTYLMKKHIEFEQEKIFSFAKQYRYDFYIPKKRTVIEVHGAQHYDKTLFLSPEEQKKIDEEKSKILKKHKLNLIVFDARISEIDFFRESHKNNYQLNNLVHVNSLNKEAVLKNIETNINIQIGKLYNSFNNPSPEIVERIADEFKLSLSQTKNILHKMSKAGICEYTKHTKNRKSRQIMQRVKFSKFTCIWESISSAEKYFSSKFKKKEGAIRRVLYRNKKEAYHSNWDYYDS